MVAEESFDLADADRKVGARLYEPVLEPDGRSWTAWVEIDAPFSCRRPAGGETSLEALVMGLRLLSILLYGAEGYRLGKLGRNGAFGGSLGLPAYHLYLEEAPYPF